MTPTAINTDVAMIGKPVLAPRKVELRPLEGVRGADGRWEADDGEAWLAVPALARLRSRWIRIRYRCGWFDPCGRPLIRFTDADGAITTAAMNGALEGLAEWTGRVPDRCVAVAIAPVRGTGRFSFAIDGVWVLSRASLAGTAMRRHPRLAAMAIGARIIGARAEARHCLGFALAADGPGRERPLHRPIDLEGFDRPRSDWRAGPLVHFLLAEGGGPGESERIKCALEAQLCDRWRLHRITPACLPGTLAALGIAEGDLVASLEPGCELLPWAVALLLEAFARQPEIEACYGDEWRVDADGSERLRLKPDHSPVLQEACDYIGPGAAFRVASLPGRAATPVADATAMGAILSGRPPGAVGHVRRPLFRRRDPGVPGISSVEPLSPLPRTAVIVPTRDRPDLLATCLAGLDRLAARPGVSIVIVDNGTTDARALAYLRTCETRAGWTVLRAPGPFNYAALCNGGAAATDADLLLFLNNDIRFDDADWLGRMARWAMRPDIGAVGARLLYPDGRIQHDGVVLGLGGAAGHAFRQASVAEADAAFGAAPREVSAVTGAVQMVERAKFDAVGGFDEVAFPVLYNDTDLCLRLAARGWRTLIEPAACLVHDESASRGHPLRPFTRHARERAAFIARWGDAIRDDPFHHPALSLHAWRRVLGG